MYELTEQNLPFGDDPRFNNARQEYRKPSMLNERGHIFSLTLLLVVFNLAVLLCTSLSVPLCLPHSSSSKVCTYASVLPCISLPAPHRTPRPCTSAPPPHIEDVQYCTTILTIRLVSTSILQNKSQRHLENSEQCEGMEVFQQSFPRNNCKYYLIQRKKHENIRARLI